MPIYVDTDVVTGQKSPVMLTGDQICAGRGPMKLGQADLARMVGVSRDTIVRAEKAGPEVPRFLASGTMLDIVRLFESGGWSFHVDGSIAGGVRMTHPTLSGLGPSAEHVDAMKRLGFGPKDRDDMSRRIAENQRAAAVGMTMKQLRTLNRMEGDALRKRQGLPFNAIDFLASGIDFFARERRMPTLDELMPPASTDTPKGGGHD
ncbi:hypothetical protein ACJ41P_10715 [Azospirillum argentinense]|uniref:HTH cro/C1-type domain-containing protein n=1 Tax=Azospirillum argentinense TaxID=2970906 RepID=A0ABW8V5F3_9PROT